MNKRRLIILILVVLLLNVQWAAAGNTHSATNVRMQWQSGRLTVSYDLKKDVIVDLRVKCKVNGKSTTRDLYAQGKNNNEKVKGDVGYVMAGSGKSIEWSRYDDDAFSEVEYVESVEVITHYIFKPAKVSLLGSFGYSFKPEQMSYGMLIGVTSNKNGWGGFLHFRSNYNFGVRTSYTCDENGYIDGLSCYYSGETKSLFYMANVGAMYNFLKDKRSKSMVSLGLGVGYGSREVYWQMESGEWVNNAGLKNSGVSAELNLIGVYKMFSLMAGVNTVNFKYVDLEVGIGVTF